MPSKASSLNHSHSPKPTARYLFFKRDLKDNGVWLFVLSLLFLLAEPFILYLTGVTSADLSHNQLWGAHLGASFKEFTQDVQAFVLAILMVLGLAFLAYRLFNFLFNKEESYFFLTLPLSRTRLFLNRYVAGLILISLAFLVEFLVMLLIFFLPPANLAPYFQDWLSLRLNFYLASLAFFSSLVWCFILVGHFADGLLTALGLNLILPLMLALLGVFVRDSVAGYIPSPGENFYRNVSLLAPGMQLFLPRRGLTDGLFSLASWTLWGCLSLAAFRRRPAERAGSRLSNLPHSWPLSLLYSFFGGVLGGFFMEALTGRQTILYFLAGFVLFSCLAHLLYQVMVQGPLKGAGRNFAVKVLAAIILMVVFDLAVETYPAEAPRYWQDEDVVSADLELGRIPYLNWHLRESPVDLHIDKDTGPESLSALLKAYQEGPHLSERQGFINDNAIMRRQEGRRVSFSGYNIPIEFTRVGGRKDKVLYYYEDLHDFSQALTRSAAYQPLSQLENTDYQAGDRLYLELTLYDDTSGLDAFVECIDQLASYPYFQVVSPEDRRPMPYYEGNPWSSGRSLPMQVVNRERQQVSLVLRDREARELVAMIKEGQAQTSKSSELMYQAEPIPNSADNFNQELDKFWSGLDVNFRLYLSREIALPGLSISKNALPKQGEDPLDPEAVPGADLALDSIHLEQSLPLYDSFQEASQAYMVQLLQGVAHD